MKLCRYCGEYKQVAEFYKAGANKLSARCRICHGLGDRTCFACGKSFVGSAGTKACSPECASTFRPKTFNQCVNCGDTFGPVDRFSRMYCSNKCKYESIKGKHTPWNKGISVPQLWRAKIKNCLMCGSQFRAVADYKDKKQIYCSHNCYLKNRKVSIPEIMAGEWLKSHNVPFEHQKKIGRWSFDYFINDIGLVVEIDGAFWHSSPIAIGRDRRKDAAITEMGLEIIRVDAESVRVDPSSALGAVIRRWQNYTGKQAILESTGEAFDG